MPEIDMILFVIITLGIFSIIFSVVASIFLSKLSSKINHLETEIQKRSVEFDTFKKERLNSAQTSIGASVIEANEPLPDTTEPSPSQENSIQIFRNVGGTFENSSQSSPFSAENTQSIPTDNRSESIDLNVAPAIQTGDVHQARKKVFNDTVPAPYPPVEPEQKKPLVLQKIQAEEPADISTPTFTLPLYSDITKDADFQTLWKKTTAILQNHPDPHVAIDLSNINFLYEKEMDYLERINYLICSQGGSLVLINCEQDLLTLINRKKQLSPIIKL